MVDYEVHLVDHRPRMGHKKSLLKGTSTKEDYYRLLESCFAVPYVQVTSFSSTVDSCTCDVCEIGS